VIAPLKAGRSEPRLIRVLLGEPAPIGGTGVPLPWSGPCRGRLRPRPGSPRRARRGNGKTAEPPAVQGVRVERTTRFEPATLTLARYADLFRRPAETSWNRLWPAVLVDHWFASFRTVSRCLAACTRP